MVRTTRSLLGVAILSAVGLPAFGQATTRAPAPDTAALDRLVQDVTDQPSAPAPGDTTGTTPDDDAAPPATAPASPTPAAPGQTPGGTTGQAPNAAGQPSAAPPRLPYATGPTTPRIGSQEIVTPRSTQPVREFSIVAGVGVEEIFTTNPAAIQSANGVALPGTKKPDFDTKLSADLGIEDTTERFHGSFQNTISGDLYAKNGSFDRISDYMTADAEATLIRDMLFLDAEAFATPVSLSNIGPIDAETRALPNQGYGSYDESVGYVVSPQLRNRIGGFATNDLAASEGGVYFINRANNAAPVVEAGVPPLTLESNTQVADVTETLTSGPDFGRAYWQGNLALTHSFGDERLTEKVADGELGYWVTRHLLLDVVVGGEAVKSSLPLSRNLDGPFWSVGFRVLLGPNFDLSLNAGQKYRRPSITGNLTWIVGAHTSIQGNLSDEVSSPAERILNTLEANTDAARAAADQSNPDEPSPRPPAPLPADQLALTNSVNRYRTAQLGITRSAGRTTTSLTGFYTKADTLSLLPSLVPTDDRSYGATLAVTQRLTRTVTGRLAGSYSLEHQLGLSDDVYRADADVTWLLSPKLDVNFGASYLSRIESVPIQLVPVYDQLFGTGSLHDFELYVGAHQRF